MPPEAKAKYQCPSCSKHFGRSEHLRRHALVHSESKFYQCQHCSKGFVRRDALSRHILTHGAPPSLLQRGGRACTNCQKAKVRCSGDKECVRCSTRALRCEYPVSDCSNSEAGVIPRKHLPSSSLTLHAQPNADTQGCVMERKWAFMPGQGLPGGGTISASSGSYEDVLNLPACGSGSSSDASAPAGRHPFLQEQLGPQTLVSQPADYRDNDHIGDSSHSTTSSHPAIAISWSDGRSLYNGDGLEPSGEAQLHVGPTNFTLFTPSAPASLVEAGATPTTFSPKPTALEDAGPYMPSAVSLEVFDEIVSLHRRLCLWPPAPWKAIDHFYLPDRATLGRLIHLYYLHFDKTLPMWHAVLFEKAEQHPVLIVAMTAIGSIYSDAGEDSIRTSNLLLEFGRRCLVFSREHSADGTVECIPVVAAQLLQIIGMAYSEHENFRRRALDSKRELGQILEFCQRELEKYKPVPSAVEVGNDLAWLPWCRRESLIRLASSIWLVDCMLAYHFEVQPSFGLSNMRYPLPCTERMWYAKSAQEWGLHPGHAPQWSLGEVMQDLYVNKRLAQETGEFARIIIIHGLYQRTWEVWRYFENPLSSWSPSAGRNTITDMLPKASVDLRSIPEVMSWQTAAFNAFALMHWQANAKISLANGREHATVLHLHVARIVLLAPYVQIIHFARMMGSGYGEDESTAISKQTLRRWAGNEQTSARAATVHAGLVFWHCRLEHRAGFYEPHSVAIAALLLWAFAMFSGVDALLEESDPSPAGLEDAEQSDDAACEIILLDRPTDEELVQQFVQSGRNMRIHMAGVEDLYGPRGPESVLEQGAKLLSSMPWGAGSSWRQLLQRLTEVSRKRRESIDD